MADTSVVYARIDSELKENAEGILKQLGITPSAAIQMLYSQVVLTRSFPVSLRLRHERPTSLEDMTQEELNAKLAQAIESADNGDFYTEDQVDRIMGTVMNT